MQDLMNIDELKDGELLEQFAHLRDEGAFRAIVERHGPLVLHVCKGMLRREQDAEDAFQATFLVLAQRAHKIRKRMSLASWLHGTAYRVCLKASARIQRRKEEVVGDSMIMVDEGLEEVADQHAQTVLHEELNSMPERYRAALVICYLEGKSREEAASQLGCTVGAVKGRLERGRQVLRTRMLARGMASVLFAGMAAGGLTATEALADSFIASTVDAAVAHAGGQSITGSVSSHALALAQGELSVMTASPLTKSALATVSSFGLVGICLFMLVMTPAARADKPVVELEIVKSPPPPANDARPLVIAQAPNKEVDKQGDSDEAGVIQSRARVGKMIWSPNGKSLLFGGPVDPKTQPGEMAIEMWLFQDSRTVPLPAARERCFTVSPDGKTYVTVKQLVVKPEQRTNLEVRIHDLGADAKLRDKFLASTGTRLFQTYGLEMSSDGKRLATCGFSFPRGSDGQGDILIVDLETKKVRALGKGANRAVYCLAFSPDGKKLATGRLIMDKSETGIEVWDVESGKRLHQWQTHRGMMWNLAFSPDGTRLASVGHSHDRKLGWEKLVSVHNLKTGKLERNLAGHEKSPATVAFSPNGKLLATGGVDKQVIVWDVATGKVKAKFSGHEAAVDGVTFSPKGDKIASGDRGKTIRIWDLAASP